MIWFSLKTSCEITFETFSKVTNSSVVFFFNFQTFILNNRILLLPTQLPVDGLEQRIGLTALTAVVVRL